LLELLASGRSEVMVAAAWGLRRLAVPDTLPRVLDFFQSPHWDRPAEATDQQLSQLAQFLGQGRYRPADAGLRRLLARPSSPGRSCLRPEPFRSRPAAGSPFPWNARSPDSPISRLPPLRGLKTGFQKNLTSILWIADWGSTITQRMRS